MPNGIVVCIEYSRNVIFTSNVYLTNVLYVPKFSFNLISVSQLLKSLNNDLTFSPISCVIHDSQTKDKIDLVRNEASLYIFNSNKQILSNNHNASLNNCSVKILICGIIDWVIFLMINFLLCKLNILMLLLMILMFMVLVLGPNKETSFLP